MAEVAQKIIRGTFGRLWLNGELLANIKSFEAKATLNYEEVQINGNFATQQRYTGYSLAGTMTLHKVDSRIAKLLSDNLDSGQMPTIKLVGALADVDSSGSERIEIYDVTLDEFVMLGFENATIGEESVPFKAGGFKYLDTI